MSRLQQAMTCYSIALGLAVTTALIAPDHSEGAQLLTMLTPAAAVLLMITFAPGRQGRRASWRELGLGRLGIAQLPSALALPALVLGATYGVASLLHPFEWNPPVGAYSHALLTLPIVLAFVTLEEVCWRGYLLPRFEAGPWWRRSAVVGSLHGVWHLPLIMLTTSYLDAGSRGVVVPVFLALLASAGIVYGWLRTVSGSLWPVIVMHAWFNLLLGLATVSIRPNGGDSFFLYATGESGVLTLAATAVVAVLLMRGRTSAGVDQLTRTSGVAELA